MTVVLDHEGSPFFAGTYFPDQPRHGQPSFRQVLEAVTDAWTNRSDDVRKVAGQLRDHLNRPAASAVGSYDAGLLERAVVSLSRDFDTESAGFGGAPKFPPSMVLEFLLRVGEEPMLDATLGAMARGGIYDQLGGGFARYSVDGSWVVPHFEKMLYDNALLLGVYARWATARGAAMGARVATETADFLLRELRTDEGGFASALDADSEGVEGKFYAWTPAELVVALGEHDGRWAARTLEVTDSGTFEDGASTLQLLTDPDDLARWDDVRRRLLEARSARVRPARDDKVVAAWNGLAISGLCASGLLLDRRNYLDAAREAGTLLADLHVRDGRLLRVSRQGVAGAHPGVLEDHGCVAGGFLALLQATGDPVWLERAGALLDVALEHFRAEDGGFFDTADDAEALIARPRDPSDNASPSGVSATVHALTAYAALTGSRSHREAAEAALATTAPLAQHAPRFAGWSLAAGVALLDGPREIAVVGPPGQARDTLAAAARRDPAAVVVVADADPGDGRIPLLTGRSAIDGAPAAYVCRHHVCERPVTDADALPR